ncbi:MAG: enoyl-CoA hydratase-related protein [Pseudomonadales bacterium]
MSYECIQTERQGHIFIVTIDRPDVMNAVSPAANFEMEQAFNEFEADADLLVAIVTGTRPGQFSSTG